MSEIQDTPAKGDETMKRGDLHTRFMEAFADVLKLQHPDAFTEEADDGELVIPTGCTPRSAYAKIDVSWLAEEALRVAESARISDAPSPTQGLQTPSLNEPSWRPIESAPRPVEGTPLNTVLLAWTCCTDDGAPTYRVSEAYWCPEDGLRAYREHQAVLRSELEAVRKALRSVADLYDRFLQTSRNQADAYYAFVKGKGETWGKVRDLAGSDDA